MRDSGETARILRISFEAADSRKANVKKDYVGKMPLRFRYCLFHGRSLANDVKLWNGRSNSTDTPSFSILVVDDQNSIGPEPDGADIEVDGSFVGNTHQISMFSLATM